MGKFETYCYHQVGLKADGSVVMWGKNPQAQCANFIGQKFENLIVAARSTEDEHGNIKWCIPIMMMTPVEKRDAR